MFVDPEAPRRIGGRHPGPGAGRGPARRAGRRRPGAGAGVRHGRRPAAAALRAGCWVRWTVRLLDRARPGCVLLCPLFLLHGRLVADVLLAIVAVAFLARSALARDWRWLRTRWVLGRGAGGRGCCCARCQGGCGRGRWRRCASWCSWRRWSTGCCGCRGAGCGWPGWLRWRRSTSPRRRAAVGHRAQPAGLRPVGRWRADGAVPAPAGRRAVVPPAVPRRAAGARMGARLGPLGRAGLLVGGRAVVVLIGQRMPVLLTGLGLLVTALLLPRLRTGVLAPASGRRCCWPRPPWWCRRPSTGWSTSSPPDGAFPGQPVRPDHRAGGGDDRAHPVFGLGFDGFRHAAPTRRISSAGAAATAAGPTCACSTRTTTTCRRRWRPGCRAWRCSRAGAGLAAAARPRAVAGPGAAAGRAVRRRPDPGVAGRLDQRLPSMPLSGWFFLLLGLGLAETRPI